MKPNRIPLPLALLLLGSGLAGADAAPKKLSSLDASVPEQSILTLSMRIGKLLDKGDYDKRINWRPALERNAAVPGPIKSIVQNPTILGLNLHAPTHFFAQLSHREKGGLILGALASVKDKEALNGHLEAFSKPFGIVAEKNKGLILRAKEGIPFLTAQRGSLLLLLFAAPSAMDSPLNEGKEELPDISNRLQEMARAILKPKEPGDVSSGLAVHLGRPYDCSLFIDYNNFARFAQLHAPDDQFKNILNLFHAFKGSLSLTATFLEGGFSLKFKQLPAQAKSLFSGTVDKELARQLPGNAMGIGGFSLDRSVLKDLLTPLVPPEPEESAEHSPDSKTDFSPAQAIDALTGDFVFALSRHRPAVPVVSAGVLPDWTAAPAAFFLGAEIGDQRKLDLLLSYAKQNNFLDYFLTASNLILERTETHLFITTPDHRREITAGKPLRKLSKKELAAITKGPLSARLDLRAFARSLRQAIPPHYEFLMAMDVLEEFDKVVLSSGDDADLILRVSLRDKKQNALGTLASRWETEFSDRRNANLFRAIAANDLRLVDQQIRQGALVNAPDRSGHTPMHFAAYRGSPDIFEYLLRNGGRIDVRGRDRGTPLHSAVWGRNGDVVKVLIENGAEVNARSDEGETPAMTAALRGEQEILEILLSLAADPKARDKYDTVLLELAAAGGHAAIYKKLQAIGVKPKYPFHVAAGLGDDQAIRKLVSSGTPVDQRDGFGATPLLFATIAGKREIFNFLLSKKADPKIVANEGYTLMHAAAFAKDKALISRLLDLGLDVNARHGEEGITPTDVAHEDSESVELLRLHGGKTSWELGRP